MMCSRLSSGTRGAARGWVKNTETPFMQPSSGYFGILSRSNLASVAYVELSSAGFPIRSTFGFIQRQLSSLACFMPSTTRECEGPTGVN